MPLRACNANSREKLLLLKGLPPPTVEQQPGLLRTPFPYCITHTRYRTLYIYPHIPQHILDNVYIPMQCLRSQTSECNVNKHLFVNILVQCCEQPIINILVQCYKRLFANILVQCYKQPFINIMVLCYKRPFVNIQVQCYEQSFLNIQVYMFMTNAFLNERYMHVCVIYKRPFVLFHAGYL